MDLVGLGLLVAMRRWAADHGGRVVFITGKNRLAKRNLSLLPPATGVLVVSQDTEARDLLRGEPAPMGLGRRWPTPGVGTEAEPA
jgi:hypothetical protein